MNRRAFVATAGAVAVAGCSALGTPPQEYQVSIESGDLFHSIEPTQSENWGIGTLRFDLTPTTGRYVIHVIDDTRRRDSFGIEPEQEQIELNAMFTWQPPLRIEARGDETNLLDSATVRRAGA